MGCNNRVLSKAGVCNKSVLNMLQACYKLGLYMPHLVLDNHKMVTCRLEGWRIGEV